MALPPSIPTSFVPHPTTVSRRFRSDFTNAFSFFAYFVLAVIFAMALGVFFYGRILAADKLAKDEELAKAENAIDPDIAESFVKLRNRLSSGGQLLSSHVAFSEFFTLLEKLTPTTARLSSLHLSINDKGNVKLEGTGVAKSFNALAVASTAFAKDGRIKDAIFSNIVVSQRDGSVSFALSASLDQKLIAFSPGVDVVATHASTTAAGSTSSPQATSTKTTP